MLEGSRMRQFKYMMIMASALVASGCAMTYQEPATVEQQAMRQIQADQVVIMKSAKRVLTVNGFQITAFDDEAGVISTAPKNMRLAPGDADCGRTMGIDYLKDKRTTTQVAVSVLVQDGSAQVKASINGEYRPGDVSQDMMLSCVSRGTVEQKLLNDIAAGK